MYILYNIYKYICVCDKDAIKRLCTEEHVFFQI